MSKGGSRFAPAFEGDWYDVSERTVLDSSQRLQQDPDKDTVSVYIYYKNVVEYRKERVTSAENVVREASGIGTGPIDLFTHSMLPKDVTEVAGLHHWYDKRTYNCTVEFDIRGVAKFSLLQRSEDPSYTRTVLFEKPKKAIL